MSLPPKWNSQGLRRARTSFGTWVYVLVEEEVFSAPLTRAPAETPPPTPPETPPSSPPRTPPPKPTTKVCQPYWLMLKKMKEEQ